MNKFWRIGGLLLAGMGLVAQADASPVMVFGAVNESESILFSTVQNGATLSATVTFTLDSWTAGQAKFATSVVNGSTGSGTNRLMSFGIDVVSPTLTGASGSGVWDAGINTTLPSFASVDLCIWGSNNCSGGAINNGLSENQSDAFVLTLLSAGDFTKGISFIGPYGMKFQDVGTLGKSVEVAGCVIGTPGCGDPRTVPEPATLGLLGAAAIAAALASKRRTR